MQPGGEAKVSSAPGAGKSGAGPRLLYALATVALLCALCAPLFVDSVDHSAPRAANGIVDLSHSGPLKAPVELSGVWTLVWRSGAPGPPVTAVRPARVPGIWTDKAPGETPLPDHGAASYRLTLKGLQ